MALTPCAVASATIVSSQLLYGFDMGQKYEALTGKKPIIYDLQVRDLLWHTGSLH